MINMVQNAKDQAAALAMAAYQAAVADGTLPQAEVKTAPVEIPKDTANGDYTTTFCLAAAKAMKMNPRQVAQTLIDHTTLSPRHCWTTWTWRGATLPPRRLRDRAF